MSDLTEIIVNNEVIKPERFLSFGYDHNYIAVKGNQMYYKIKDNLYQLLGKKNVSQPILEERVKEDVCIEIKKSP